MLSKVQEILEGSVFLHDLPDEQLEYCIENYKSVIEYLNTQPRKNRVLFRFLKKNPKKSAAAPLKKLALEAGDCNFRAHCARLLKHYPGSATVKCLNKVIYDLMGEPRCAAAESLDSLGESSGLSYWYENIPRPNLVEILNNYENYEAQGHHILLFNLGSQGTITWDSLAKKEPDSWCSRKDVISALENSSESLLNDLELILQNTVKCIESLSKGEHMSTAEWAELENILFVCSHGLTKSHERRKTVQRLTRRLLRAPKPKSWDGSYLSKYFNEYYASIRFQALSILNECGDDTGMAEILGIRKKCEHTDCETVLVNPKHNHCKKHYNP